MPVAVVATGALNGKTVTSISAGTYHSLALASDGKVYAWGQNDKGQLGNGTTTNSSVPVAVTATGVLAGKTVTAIAGTGDHKLVKTSDNALYTWGFNDAGQLGNNTTTNSTVPVPVLFGTPSVPNNITTTPGDGALALTWKKPIAVYGQAVTGYSLQYRTLGATTWTTASVAGDVTSYTLGSLANGTKYQLRLAAVTAVGVGDYSDIRLATPHVAPTITSVSPEAGTVAGGTGTTITGTDFEIKGKDVVQVAQGGSHYLALASDGTVYAWGQNGAGQLGNNSTTDTSVPVAVTTAGTPMDGKTITAIAAGGSHSLALASDGTVYAWGHNTYGQLGNNSTTQSNVPVAVTMTGALAGKTITQVSVGHVHSCVLDSAGTTYCWGFNTDGELGNNSTTQSTVPVAVNTSGVLAGKTIIQISANYAHTCVLDSAGAVYCWGYGIYGQLGNNSATTSLVPVAVYTSGVLSDKTVTQISTGRYYACAIDSTGKSYCWGRNLYGELGNNSTTQSNVPVAVNTSGVLSGKTITHLATGHYHTCALDSAGTTYCWGLNANGQVGNGTTTNSSVPVAVNTAGVLAGKTITTVSAGYYSSLALASDGTTYTWGQNTNGQLGNNSTTNSSVPVAVSTSGTSALSPSVPAVTFDGTPATGVTVVDRTTITATTPAHATGAVDVVANLGGGDANYQATRTDGYTYADAPGAPTALTATPADDGVDLSWTAPAANGSAITDYVVQYSPDGGATWATYADGTATGTTATVPTPTLNSTTEYTFRVAAVNVVGQGAWSNTDSARVLYITLTAPSSVAVNVTPMGGARMSSSSQNIVVSTNGVAGYRLTLNSASTDRDLAKGSSKITPVAGTQGLPISLTGSTWGYRVDGVGGFGATTTGETNTTASSYAWAGIPDLNSPEIIRTQTSAVSSQTTTVWYGVNVEEDKPSGLYAGTVTYTAVTRD